MLLLTDPEVSHGVDFYRLLNQRIRSVDELLSRHNPGVVDQDADVTDLSLHLRRRLDSVCHA